MKQLHDFSQIYAGLKDFQLNTVEYVFKRMYVDRAPSRRFLVADEVGLGKTLVAKGVVARTIEHLQTDEKKNLQILYICSNADIAAQNLRKINIVGKDHQIQADRLTLLAKELDTKREGVTFVAFTPGTSFNLKSSLGRFEERVLLYRLLRSAWGGDALAAPGARRLLQGEVGTDRFRAGIKSDEPVSKTVTRAFVEALRDYDAQLRAQGQPSLRRRFGRLSREVGLRRNLPSDVRDEQRDIIGRLRHLLARVCLDALAPSLVILDEFQRFRHLLHDDETDEAALLAQELFNTKDLRVLMLSATPYKMLTLRGEADGEDHHKDLIQTLRFLDDGVAGRVDKSLRELRRLLFSQGGPDEIRELRDSIVRDLRRVMVRTERLAMTADRDGMLRELRPEMTLAARDLAEYINIHELTDLLEAPDALELWKSSPYLLNFMERYAMKSSFEKAQRSPQPRLLSLIENSESVLDWEGIRTYAELDPANPRMRAVQKDTIESGAWKLLWIPPSLPYYAPGPPFDSPEIQGFTKKLIFSAWAVVPKAIASLLSYGAERESMAGDDRDYSARSQTTRLLDFRMDTTSGRLASMPVFALVYPSPTLADAVDPLTDGAGSVSIEELRTLAKQRLQTPLDAITTDQTEGPADERWYWAAPVLLDEKADPTRNRRWWDHRDLPSVWVDAADDQSASAYWPDHVHEARQALSGMELGRPPEDLMDVLADLALGGPANVALRTLSRPSATAPFTPSLRDDAAAAAWSFRSLFNQPESMGIVRQVIPEVLPYWRKVLKYCMNGDLLAVLDEYAHVLPEWVGVAGDHPEDVSLAVVDALRRALSLRAVSYRIDDIRCEDGRITSEREGLRGHFAFQFGNVQSEETKQVARSSHVREAFNSPFWPFVLTTTSVGQEGLDFHLYCHAVVHWNLPSNPVDLEQREGRIHRYKNHAVRKNLAEAHSAAAFEGKGDPWMAMFTVATETRREGYGDLIPFWLMEGDAKIERHVPVLPLSRDLDHLSALRRTLGAYRLAFGQPRQADLLEYLRTQRDDIALEELHIDLSPPVAKALILQTNGQPTKRSRADRRGLGATRASRWTESRFFEVIEKQSGPDAARKAKRVLEWAHSHHLRLDWGHGTQEGAFYPYLEAPAGITHLLFSINTSGRSNIQFAYLKENPPYNDRAARLELITRLNTIEGISIREAQADRYPGVLFKAMENPALEAFLEVWDSAVASIRSHTQSR